MAVPAARLCLHCRNAIKPHAYKQHTGACENKYRALKLAQTLESAKRRLEEIDAECTLKQRAQKQSRLSGRQDEHMIDASAASEQSLTPPSSPSVAPVLQVSLEQFLEANRRIAASHRAGTLIGISALVKQRYEERFRLMRDAAFHSIDFSLGIYRTQLASPSTPFSSHLPSLSPALTALGVVLSQNPISIAALTNFLGWVDAHFVPRDTSTPTCATIADGKRILAKLTEPLTSIERKFTLAELDGPLDAELRNHLHPALHSSNFAKCIPSVSYQSNVEAFLFHLVQPYWKSGRMRWHPAEQYRHCGLKGSADRFYRHPYDSDVAIKFAAIAKERCGRHVPVLGIVFYVDASAQHAKNHLNVAIGILPETSAFLTDRARETFLTMTRINIPKEMRASHARSAYTRLSSSLYHRAMYTALIEPLNKLIENGTSCMSSYVLTKSRAHMA